MQASRWWPISSTVFVPSRLIIFLSSQWSAQGNVSSLNPAYIFKRYYDWPSDLHNICLRQQVSNVLTVNYAILLALPLSHLILAPFGSYSSSMHFYISTSVFQPLTGQEIPEDQPLRGSYISDINSKPNSDTLQKDRSHGQASTYPT